MLELFMSGVSWLEEMLISLGLDEKFQSIGTSAHEIALGTALFGVGFILGYLGKRYFKLMVLVGIVVFAGVKLLEYKGMIVVDWSLLTQYTGDAAAAPVESVQGILMGYVEWAKQNVVAAAGLVIGLYLGIAAE